MNKTTQFGFLALFMVLPLVGLYLKWQAIVIYSHQKANRLVWLAFGFLTASMLVIYYGDLFLLQISIAGILGQGWTLPVALIFSEVAALLIIPGTLIAILELQLLRLASKFGLVPPAKKLFKAQLLLLLANLLISLPIGWYWLIIVAKDIVTVRH